MTDVRPTAPAPEPGPLPDRLGERFQLGELLGRGTCSEVYRAHDLLLDREAAVKIFPVAGDPRIEREVRLMASMDHPSLVPVYDVGHDAGRAFVVMALLEGGSLTDRLADGPLGVGETLLAVASVADGLSHVHRAGVLHRDVTPRNVLFDGDGRAHLSDFGVAFVADAPRITDTGIVVGSAPYLAPEQVRGEAVGAPADVYALGLVMIEALTARPAYPGAPLAAARARLEHRPEMPAGLEIEVLALLEAMTADDPAHRPTAENVCIGLRRAALAAEAATPPYAMAPIVGAGTPDATTRNLRPVDATAAVGVEPASAETPLAAVPERRRRRLADAGGFMVAASVAAAVLLAGGVVVASAWTVDRVNTATPPAATVPPPTAEVVADPGGSGGGHSLWSNGDDGGDDSGDDARSSTGSTGSTDGAERTGSDRQAVAERREPTTAPVTDGGSTSTDTPEPSSTTPTTPTTPTTSSPTGTTTTGSTTTSPTGTSSNLVPGLPSLPILTVPGGTTTTSPTTQSTPDSSSSTAPTTTDSSTTHASTTHPTTTHASSTPASATASATTTTTTTHTAARTRALLDPAVEALGGLLR
ncbi:serine/threonine-protein kinase [Actinomycetospora flava]|uniref:non-specific serine/threonine protein kinase n=1 Tax=Actinomycetospora flava TaxID=3129232 RepID=A0ABU8MF23_9PSEU